MRLEGVDDALLDTLACRNEVSNVKFLGCEKPTPFFFGFLICFAERLGEVSPRTILRQIQLDVPKLVSQVMFLERQPHTSSPLRELPGGHRMLVRFRGSELRTSLANGPLAAQNMQDYLCGILSVSEFYLSSVKQDLTRKR